MERRIDFESYSLSSYLFEFCKNQSDLTVPKEFEFHASVHLILMSCISFEGLLLSYICREGIKVNESNSMAKFEDLIVSRDKFFESFYWKKGRDGLKKAFKNHFGQTLPTILGDSLFQDLALAFELRNLLAHGRDIEVWRETETSEEAFDAVKDLSEFFKKKPTKKQLDIFEKMVPKGSKVKKHKIRYVGSYTKRLSELWDRMKEKGLITIEDVAIADTSNNDPINKEGFLSML